MSYEVFDLETITNEQSDLYPLLQVIRGRTWPFSPGIATYPDLTSDHNQMRLYAACEFLEKYGLVMRRVVEPMETIPGCVLFFPTEESAS